MENTKIETNSIYIYAKSKIKNLNFYKYVYVNFSPLSNQTPLT